MLRSPLTLRLRRPITDFQTERDFKVLVSAGSRLGTQKKSWTEANGAITSISPCDPDMANVLGKWHNTDLCAPISQIVESSLRFFRTDTLDPYKSVTEYDEAVFIQIRTWERTFTISPSNSFCFQTVGTSELHKEACRSALELFGYGLALYSVSKVLGIPLNHFYFLDKNGVRPDFDAKVSVQELKDAGFSCKAVGPDGLSIHIEVKAQRGDVKSNSDTIPKKLLLDFEAKSAGLTGNFIGVYVAVPSPRRQGQGHTRVILADPGRRNELDKTSQAELLLTELFFQCYRFGLWTTARNILEWKRFLKVSMSVSETLFLNRDFKGSQVDDATNTVRRTFEIASGLSRTYRGRIFSQALEALGSDRNRSITIDDATRMLQTDELSHGVFKGLDTGMFEIIEKRDLSALLTFGVRGYGDIDLSGFSPVIEHEVTLNDQEVMEVRSAFKRAIDRSRMTGVW